MDNEANPNTFSFYFEDYVPRFIIQKQTLFSIGGGSLKIVLRGADIVDIRNWMQTTPFSLKWRLENWGGDANTYTNILPAGAVSLMAPEGMFLHGIYWST